MANVLIRNIPEEVLDRLKNMAKSHKRSLQQELRVVLEKTVDQSSHDIFQKASDLRRKLRKKAVRFTDSAKLLREDRAR
jgi:plasmid stability protein